MTQRVNLQYTVDIEELPQETNRLVHKALRHSKESTCILSELSDDDNILTLSNLECIDKARLKLMNIDYVLQDIQNIIKGYLAHKSGLDQQPQQHVPNASLYEPSELNLDDLEKQINSFKETFEQETAVNTDATNE